MRRVTDPYVREIREIKLSRDIAPLFFKIHTCCLVTILACFYGLMFNILEITLGKVNLYRQVTANHNLIIYHNFIIYNDTFF
jgi:hypothetical protein